MEKIGVIHIPEPVSAYVEGHYDRILIEQSAYDAVNGYAVGVGTKLKIQRYGEYCEICGYNSISNPNQKRLITEYKHRFRRRYETIFSWDDYGPDSISLNEAFKEALPKLPGYVPSVDEPIYEYYGMERKNGAEN